jgi:hypothetical protein
MNITFTDAQSHITVVFTRSTVMALYFSTITVTGTATDSSGTPITNCSEVTCTVTFPDGTAQNFSLSGATVVNGGSGKYSITYTTKGPGEHKEDWVFTGPTGDLAAPRNMTPVSC